MPPKILDFVLGFPLTMRGCSLRLLSGCFIIGSMTFFASSYFRLNENFMELYREPEDFQEVQSTTEIPSIKSDKAPANVSIYSIEF